VRSRLPLGDLEGATRAFREAVELAREAGDDALARENEASLGWVLGRHGDFDAAGDPHKERPGGPPADGTPPAAGELYAEFESTAPELRTPRVLAADASLIGTGAAHLERDEQRGVEPTSFYRAVP
jgi:hypothetical protein